MCLILLGVNLGSDGDVNLQDYVDFDMDCMGLIHHYRSPFGDSWRLLRVVKLEVPKLDKVYHRPFSWAH